MLVVSDEHYRPKDDKLTYRISDKASDLRKPVLATFFLEAGFLGVMLFGISKVGKRVHFIATCMVALGALISATWVIAANSWIQTPVAYAINAKSQFVPAGPSWPIIFNHGFPCRLFHPVIACYLTTALMVGGVDAWHLLKNKSNLGARKMFSMAIWMAVMVTPIQMLAGAIFILPVIIAYTSWAYWVFRGKVDTHGSH